MHYFYKKCIITSKKGFPLFNRRVNGFLVAEKKFQFSTDWEKRHFQNFAKMQLDFQETMPQIYCSVRWMGIAFLCLRVDSFFLRKVLKPNLWWQLRDQKWSPNNSGMKKHLSRKGKRSLHSFLFFSLQNLPKKDNGI